MRSLLIMSWHQIWAHISNFAAKRSLIEFCIYKLPFGLSWAVQLSQNICSFSCHLQGGQLQISWDSWTAQFIQKCSLQLQNSRRDPNTISYEWMIDNQSDCRNFAIYPALLLTRAGIFKKWVQIWCQLNTK